MKKQKGSDSLEKILLELPEETEFTILFTEEEWECLIPGTSIFGRAKNLMEAARDAVDWYKEIQTGELNGTSSDTK